MTTTKRTSSALFCSAQARNLHARTLGPQRSVFGILRSYAGRRVLVVGSGHSAFNAIIDLTTLVREAPGTEIIWAVRRGSLAHLFGGGERDLLPARGALGTEVRRHVEDGTLRLFTGFRIVQLTADDDGITVVGEEGMLPPVDEIIATTGFRPDLSFLGELRLRLDPGVESPVELAPLIDPNYHSCGTVRPHGVDELAHPEPGFYIAGMKSYGRAPTFLLFTGYEQVRSIVAAIAGDWEAARQVQLELPETGGLLGEQSAHLRHTRSRYARSAGRWSHGRWLLFGASAAGGDTRR